MEEVLHYLEMKNHFYEKFYTITKKLLDQVARNDWNDLEFFVDSRERILNIIRSFDAKISCVVENEGGKLQPQKEDRALMNQMMKARKYLADKILELDLQVIAAIDEYKNETIRELKKTVETQQQMNAFEKNAVPQRPLTRTGKA